MRTYLECISCFFRQALEATRLAGADEAIQKKVLGEVAKLIPNFSLNLPPPEMARDIHRFIKEIITIEDPYIDIKKKNNELALKLYPGLKKKVVNSTDRLLTATELAISGNIIDYGVKNALDVENEIEKYFLEDFSNFYSQKRAVFNYQEFKQDLGKAKKVLYLADNAGEVVFDRILIEELNTDVIYAVRDKPIINDALIEDALVCGIDKYARVISSGCDGPGIILKYCSPEFIDIYNNADLIISKGQGNFETLTEEKRPIYFLFKVKCSVVAKNIGCELGSIVLKKLREGEDYARMQYKTE